MATDLGKVGMRARGSWNSSTTYEVLDVVSYNNSLYIAKQAVPANTAPTNTTYWQVAFSASNIENPVVLESIAVTTDATLGTVNFKRLSNGMKIITLGSENVSASTYTTAADFIPSSMLPVANVLTNCTTWEHAYYRKMTMNTNGRISFSPASEAGANTVTFYV